MAFNNTNESIMTLFTSFLHNKGYIEHYKWSNEYIKKCIHKTAFWTETSTSSELFVVHLFFWFLQEQYNVKIDTD